MKGKAIKNGQSLGKSSNWVWRIKAKTSISDILKIQVLASSSLSKPNLVPMTMVLVHRSLPITADSPGCVLVTDLSPEVENGETVLHNTVYEVLNEGDFNPFVSLVLLVEGVHILDSVPQLLKPILPVEDLLHYKLDYGLVLSFSNDSQKKDALGEALGEPNF